MVGEGRGMKGCYNRGGTGKVSEACWEGVTGSVRVGQGGRRIVL